MSDGLVNLLAALLGAIVGGVATLAGSMVVNRLELRRTMRLRLYDELIPKAIDVIPRSNRGDFQDTRAVDALMLAVMRASLLAGRDERKLAEEAMEN